jgi:biopolymer transport protein ExbB
MLMAMLAVILTGSVQAAEGWCDKAWGGRTAFTIETAAQEIKDPVGTAVVLVRLHQGNFPFAAAKEDASDLRVIGPDGKTPLKFHIEKWDSLLYEGYVWVQVPDIADKSTFWIYYGNAEAGADEAAADVAGTYREDTVLVYHLGERGTPPKDATAAANNATTAGVISEGALIGSGVRLLGGEPIAVPASESLNWAANQEFTWSAWIKSGARAENAVLFSRTGEGNTFRVGLNNGLPYVEVVVAGGAPQRASGADALPEGTWRMLTVVATADRTTLMVDGKEVGAIEAGVPAFAGGIFLGGDDPAAAAGNGRFVGEVDEVTLVRKALPAAAISFAALNQSTSEKAAQLLVAGEGEMSGGGGGHNEALEHVMLFGDIANDMMFDGWIAVVVCIIMMIAGGIVAIQKFVGLGKIEKGNDQFQKLWSGVGSDLTAMDLDNPKAAKDFGGKIGKKGVRLLAVSPLYYVYNVGADEIAKRLGHGKNKGQGLSARSIQAIRASLDTALVHEMHRLNKNLVYLTVCIAGGPYVGLLGTVVGVMITFAIIAKSGEVDVNSIAPGIASALLATTVGLLVAIPALFLYSFLNARIKKVIATMQVFIDEFVSKIAEFYPTPSEASLTVPIRQIRTPEEAIRNEENEAVDEEIRDEVKR